MWKLSTAGGIRRTKLEAMFSNRHANKFKLRYKINKKRKEIWPSRLGGFGEEVRREGVSPRERTKDMAQSNELLLSSRLSCKYFIGVYPAVFFLYLLHGRT